MRMQEVFKVITDHDQWSQLGEQNLGEMNIDWARRMEGFPGAVAGSGPMTLLKAILNDYWADAGTTESWTAEKVDIVMSKLYWCWVAWLQATHVEASE